MDAKDALTIPEFCVRHGLSRALLYALWRDGKGPRRMKCGNRTLISREAAADWRRDCEVPAPARQLEAA